MQSSGLTPKENRLDHDLNYSIFKNRIAKTGKTEHPQQYQYRKLF